jgi:hypothetical protein
MLKVEKCLHPSASAEEVKTYFERASWSGQIDQCNWSNFPYTPEVQFKIAHSGEDIFLQFRVHEKYIRAKCTKDNESVWTDSCVEFFISPVDDGSYYNLEFNCIGTATVGFGRGKHDRERAGEEITHKITRLSTLGEQAIKNAEGDFSWELTLIIPTEVFSHHKLNSLSGSKVRANFYKCGDELKAPHYLSWKPIQFERPNFHLPEFFGEMQFE